MGQVNGELRAQVIKEVRETGNAAMVARRHGIAVSAVYYWLKKESVSGKESSSRRDLEKKLREKELENEILKELLKKTNQAWLGDLPFPGSSSKKGDSK